MGVDGERISVLCVDDTPGLAELTAQSLERFDGRFTVRPATSARDALAILETDVVDCIVSDYDMEEMDGLTFLQLVRATDPDIPFVLLTGQGSETIASNAIAAGVTDYLQKEPGTGQHERLATRIETHVASHRARTTARELAGEIDTTLDRSPDAIVVLVDDAFVYANTAAVDLFDVTAERTLLERAIETYVHESDRGTTTSAFERVTSGDSAVEHFERLLLDIDGDRRPVEMTVRRIPWNGEAGVVAVLRDRSEREAESRLQARYQGAFEEAFDAMVVADDDGRYIEANRSACELFELEKEALLGRAIVDFAPAEYDFPTAWERFQTEGGDRGTFPLVTATGTRKTVEYAATADIVPGEHLSVLRDVTDREAYVEEIERQRSRLDEFASVVSHDLRNPLQTAIGALDAARTTDDPTHIERIERGLDRMERIIDDVLWLAREGEDIGTTQRVSLRRAIDDAWDVVDTGDGTLVVEDVPDIEADYDRVCQLLENVFRNALEHGGRDVTVRVLALDDGFAIEDDGPGIPAADRDRVFDRGFSTSADGTGFGLHIVATIATGHGWEVRATESRDGGARFEFTGVDTA